MASATGTALIAISSARRLRDKGAPGGSVPSRIAMRKRSKASSPRIFAVCFFATGTAVVRKLFLDSLEQIPISFPYQNWHASYH
jgi:hypothetical protein